MNGENRLSGQKDKNGCEIKEHDIISFMYNGIKREEVVEFRMFSFTVGLSLNFTLNYLVENNIELEVIGNHKTKTTNTMKTQLPPELVSEMYTAIGESKLCEDAAEKCANIAIQYHDMQLPKVQNTLRLNRISITELSKQRDELIDNIKELNSSIDAWWNGERSDSQVKKINAVQRKSFELLKKH